MKSLQTLGRRVTWLHAQNLGDSWDEAGSIAQGEARVYATRSQASIPFQFEQEEGNGGSLRFFPASAPPAAPEECFPHAVPGPADPARNTNCAERSSSLYLLHSFPGFEALLVQYYNLKTSIICFVLKRKIQLYFPCCSPRKFVLSEA